MVLPRPGDCIGEMGAEVVDGSGFVGSPFLSLGSSFFLPRFQNLRLPVLGS